jgi:hypothetical protein
MSLDPMGMQWFKNHSGDETEADERRSAAAGESDKLSPCSSPVSGPMHRPVSGPMYRSGAPGLSGPMHRMVSGPMHRAAMRQAPPNVAGPPF